MLSRRTPYALRGCETCVYEEAARNEAALLLPHGALVWRNSERVRVRGCRVPDHREETPNAAPGWRNSASLTLPTSDFQHPSYCSPEPHRAPRDATRFAARGQSHYVKDLFQPLSHASPNPICFLKHFFT